MHSTVSVVRPLTGVVEVGLLLTMLQALDGALTCVGISRFGVHVEGNPFLRGLMLEFGWLATLSSTKLVAVILTFGLILYGLRRPWVRNGLVALTCYYFLLAIVPWTYLLLI